MSGQYGSADGMIINWFISTSQQLVSVLAIAICPGVNEVTSILHSKL